MKKFSLILSLYFLTQVPTIAQEFTPLSVQKIYYSKQINQNSELENSNLWNQISDFDYSNNYDAFNELKEKSPASDGKNMITFSPFRIFLARLNFKYERVTDKSLTWGTRVEYGGIYQSLFINPFARLYFFDTDATGLYSEIGAYGRTQLLSESSEFYYEDISSGAGLRLHLGMQFMVGKKQNKPIDFSLFAQFDSALEEYSRYDFDEESLGNVGIATMGPAPILGFRFQTGLKFK
jgi:hypothetical protein